MPESNAEHDRPGAGEIADLSGRFRREGTAEALTIDGVRLQYWRRGDGPKTIVFVHGNSACKEVFAPQFAELADAGVTLLAFDLPGHGGSSNAAQPQQQYTIPGYARLLKRAIDALSIDRPLIVGWSLGGHIALEMAGRGFPLAGALIAGTPPLGPGLDDFAVAMKLTDAGAVTTKADASAAEIRAYVKSLYGTLDPIPDLFFSTALRTDGEARAIMAQHWLAGVGMCNQRSVAETWEPPLCVVHGLDDPFISYDYLKAMSWRNLWAGKIFEFSGIGHAPFLEAPAAFNRILSDFMREAFAG